MDIRNVDRLYSNHVSMDMSLYDITLTFLSTRPGQDMTTDDVVAEIIVSPQHAKNLAIALAQYVRDYEKIFGEINLNPDQKAIEEIAKERQQD